MSLQIIALIGITIIMPIVWLVAEFRANTIVRRTIGVLTILWSFGVAVLFGKLEYFDANVYFTEASSKLLHESVRHLQAGHQNSVLREWSLAKEQFGATYESRGRYSEIVDEAVKGMNRP